MEDYLVHAESILGLWLFGLLSLDALGAECIGQKDTRWEDFVGWMRR
jgi:hypothetical protein